MHPRGMVKYLGYPLSELDPAIVVACFCAHVCVCEGEAEREKKNILRNVKTEFEGEWGFGGKGGIFINTIQRVLSSGNIFE